jgi:hypothetical protein
MVISDLRAFDSQLLMGKHTRQPSAAEASSAARDDWCAMEDDRDPPALVCVDRGKQRFRQYEQS